MRDGPEVPLRAAPSPRRDRTAEVVAAHRQEIERGLAALVTPEVVAEHRRRPIGDHSPVLAWILAYFRQEPTAGKLVVHSRRPAPDGPGEADGRSKPFRLVRLSGRPGVAHEPLAEEPFATEAEALHAAFLHRLAEHGLAPGSAPRGDVDA